MVDAVPIANVKQHCAVNQHPTKPEGTVVTTKSCLTGNDGKGDTPVYSSDNGKTWYVDTFEKAPIAGSECKDSSGREYQSYGSATSDRSLTALTHTVAPGNSPLYSSEGEYKKGVQGDLVTCTSEYSDEKSYSLVGRQVEADNIRKGTELEFDDGTTSVVAGVQGEVTEGTNWNDLSAMSKASPLAPTTMYENSGTSDSVAADGYIYK